LYHFRQILFKGVFEYWYHCDHDSIINDQSVSCRMGETKQGN
jgi:hypothetical protein